MEVQSSNQSPTTSAEETQESTVREIKNECEITWDRIQEVSVQFNHCHNNLHFSIFIMLLLNIYM